MKDPLSSATLYGLDVPLALAARSTASELLSLQIMQLLVQYKANVDITVSGRAHRRTLPIGCTSCELTHANNTWNELRCTHCCEQLMNDLAVNTGSRWLHVKINLLSCDRQCTIHIIL